jgi:8-oxo-dGTP pyrophosphatase MutT (NUDIX family)/phosphohistidine phosphatase SixA
VATADGRTIRASGAVLWRQDTGTGRVEVALVHRPRYDDWSLPKGKLDPGETALTAAIREVTEETGYRAVAGPFVRRIRYPVTRRNGRSAHKTVDYFRARAVDGTFQPNEEVDELRWLSPEEARPLLTYPYDRGVLDAFCALPLSTTNVLLVRHAKAGKRSEWVGDDDLRPLSTAGRAQAAALRELLLLFGPDRVHSAPPLRCVQSVEGLAEDIGAPIQEEPLLTEKSYTADPRASESRLLEIAAAGGTPVVSSQGGIIPALVTGIAERDGLTLGEVASKKGSLWVLSFAPAINSGREEDDPPVRPRLAAAYYLPSALAGPWATTQSGAGKDADSP